MNDEHRDTRPILAGIENQLGLIVACLEAWHCGRSEKRRSARSNFVAENRKREIKRIKGIEDELIIHFAAESIRRAGPRQGNLIFELSLQVIDICPRGYIFQIGGKKLAARGTRT